MSSRRSDNESDPVSDFLASQRKSVFLSDGDVKKIVPSSHIMKTPNSSRGDILDLPHGEGFQRRSNARKSGMTVDGKKKKKGVSSDSEGETPKHRKSTKAIKSPHKSEIGRKSTHKSPTPKEKSAEKPEPAGPVEKVLIPKTDQIKKPDQPKTSDDASNQRKKSDDTSDQRKNSNDASDQRKNSNESDQRKTSADTSDQRKLSDDKSAQQKLVDKPEIVTKPGTDKKPNVKPEPVDKSIPKPDTPEKSGQSEDLSRSDAEEKGTKKGKKEKKEKKEKKDKKDKKKKGKKGGASSSEPELEKVSKKSTHETNARRITGPERSAEDDEVFQYLLDEESLKTQKFSSYVAEDLLHEMPEHQWLLVPSIKWNQHREAKERQRILDQLAAEEAARLAELAAAEMEGEELEIVSLFQRNPSSPRDLCQPNPCPCKDKKQRKSPALPLCQDEGKVEQTPSEKCWEDYLARERKERQMRWFACVLVSAHTRRPNWIPPPEEYLRQEHELRHQQAHPALEVAGEEHEGVEDVAGEVEPFVVEVVKMDKPMESTDLEKIEVKPRRSTRTKGKASGENTNGFLKPLPKKVSGSKIKR